MSNTIFVGNLSYSLEAAELQSAFANFGVTEAKIIKDFHTGRSKGYGFVSFANARDAERAVDEMNEKEISGRHIRVNLAKNKAQTHSAPQVNKFYSSPTAHFNN